jgi:cyclopropane-fatty-acyl-phospholipid synthase
VTLLSRRVSSRGASAVLRRVFGRVQTGFAFRLWDGLLVPLGVGEPVCTVVVHDPQTFVRLIRAPTPLNFAEAYVEGGLDLEGDLFSAMKVADAVEEIRVPFPDRMRILYTLWRG